MTVNVKIGFIGTGGIATALAKGFCTAPEFEGKVYVFDINKERTDCLKKLYPDKIIVAASNQELVNNVDVVFPTLLPMVLEKVAPEINFRKANHVIHIAAGTKISKAAPWFAPAQSVVRAVPLPFAARKIGPVVLFGDDELSREVLALLGTIVKVKSEKDLEVLAAVTGVMVPYYGLVGEIVRWCMTKDLDFKSALDYTSYMNEALSTLMREDCTEDIEAFMLENTTPGGMNELGWDEMKATDGYGPWRSALEKIGKHYDL
ncbi:MAG: NAD(P)-binding domain-containing protein [Cloacibacillus sp.]